MNRLKSVKYVLLIIVVSVLAIILGNALEQEKDSKIVMAMIPKVIGSSYFELCKDGAIKASTDLGIEFIYKGPTVADAASQVNIIQDMIFQEVDIIAISPIDPIAVEPMLKKAKDKGILVITFDADVAFDSREIFVSQVSEEALGRHIMDNLASGLNGKGQFGILTASLTASNQNNWIQWMEIQLEEKYPDMELVSIIPTDEDQQEAFVQTQNLIQAYPDLDGIVALSTVAVPGAARAIELLKVSGDIKLYGLALPNDMNQYLKNESAQIVTLWNPIDLGDITVRVANDVYNNKVIQNGSMYGDVGPIIYLESQSTVIMGKPLDFTKENVDNYDF